MHWLSFEYKRLETFFCASNKKHKKHETIELQIIFLVLCNNILLSNMHITLKILLRSYLKALKLYY